MDIPKNVFDKEYSTQWKREVAFLKEKGIDYVYAKKHFKYPIIKYKYTKTPELFIALAEFYKQVWIENLHKQIDGLKPAGELALEKGYIAVNASDLSKPQKELLEISDEEVDAIFEDDQ